MDKIEKSDKEAEKTVQETGTIKYCYLISLLSTICLGELQFGVSIVIWNSIWIPYSQVLDLKREDPDTYSH